MALVIAGERSGVGKTTITMSILSFLVQKGYKVQSFKVGPDYIDPMFHTAITGHASYNLDPILTSVSYVKKSFNRHCLNKDLAIVEGVMGLFDGLELNGLFDYGSTAHVARILNLSVVLVIDCSKLSSSVAAIAYGYRTLVPSVKLIGVVLNKVKSERHLELLQSALDSISMPVIGVLYQQDSLSLAQRHLGLVPAAEVQNLEKLTDKLANLIKNSFNWELLLPFLKVDIDKRETTSAIFPICSVSLALAKDKAFNFYYPDQLKNLEDLGAQLIPWSPLEDSGPPENCAGLLFGGGFPEVFAQQLSENLSAKKNVLEIIKRGIPTYGECGGLMYLSQELVDHNQKVFSMVGAAPLRTKMTNTLTLGYRQATALRNTSLLKKEEIVIGHEFHYSQLDLEYLAPRNSYINNTNNIINYLFKMSRYRSKQDHVWIEGFTRGNLQISYLHLHFAQNDLLSKRFLKSCFDFSLKNNPT